MSGEGSKNAEGTENEKEGEEKREEEEEKDLRRQWSREEDAKLLQMVDLHGPNWTEISLEFPGRSGTACRLRWSYKLTPRSGGPRWFTPEEDDIIVRAQLEHGNEWATIAESLTGRTDNAVRNRWYTNLRGRKRDAEGSRQQQQDLSSVGTSASSSSNWEIDFFERKRLCQREEEDVETPDMATMNLLDPEPVTTLSLSLPGSGGDGEESVRGKGKEKKNED